MLRPARSRSMRPELLLLSLVACDDAGGTGSGDTGIGEETGSGDTGVDTGVGEDTGVDDTADTDGDDTSTDTGGDEVTPPPPVELQGGTTRVCLGFEPFAYEVGCDAEPVGRSSDQRGSYAPLSVAVAPSYRASTYYDPRLLEADGDGRGLVWCEPVRWRAVEAGTSWEAELDCGELEVAARLRLEAGPSLQAALPGTPAEGVRLRVSVVGDTSKVAMVQASLARVAGEGNYGLGEMFDAVDAAGSLREMQIRAEGRSESATNEVHVPVSFYQTTTGLGLFADQRAPGAIDFGRSRPEVTRIAFNGTSLDLHLWADHRVEGRPLRLLQNYLGVTGLPKEVPFWALAPQWWRNVNRDGAELLDDVQRAIDADIPSTVVWIDRPWSSFYHNWRFNLAQFPDPEAMFDTLHGKGHRVLLHHSPQLNPVGSTDLGDNEDASERIFERYRDNGWLVTYQLGGQPVVLPWGGGNGGFIDYSHPDAVADQKTLIRRVTDLGAIGTKMDWDEYLQANIGPQRIYMSFHNGETNQTMHGWYSALYHKANIEAFDEALRGPSFHVSRSGMARDQVWNTCIWPGDLDNDFSENTTIAMPEDQPEWNVGGLPAALFGAQSLGHSGYPCFGSDIGGYRGGQPTEEALLRWMEMGTFHPIMQTGGGGSSHMAWTADSPYSPAAVDVTRQLFRLRMRLVWYVYAAMERAHTTGEPAVRSMWFAWPGQRDARASDRQFMLGDNLLVAPISVEGATSREVWIPPGVWIHWFTGQAYTGPSTATIEAPIGRPPVFVRAGAALQTIDPRVDSLVAAPDAAVVGFDEVRDVGLVASFGGDASTVRFDSGLTLENLVLSSAALAFEVRRDAPAAGVDRAIWFEPAAVTVEYYVAGTFFDGVAPTRVTVTRGAGGEVELAEGSGDDTWGFDAARGLLRVRLAQPGLVKVY